MSDLAWSSMSARSGPRSVHSSEFGSAGPLAVALRVPSRIPVRFHVPAANNSSTFIPSSSLPPLELGAIHKLISAHIVILQSDHVSYEYTYSTVLTVRSVEKHWE